MTTGDKFKTFTEEYEAFQSTPPLDPTEEVGLHIKAGLHRQLLVDKFSAIAALTTSYILSGLFIVTICPQFDIQLIENFGGLRDFFMIFGHYACMFLCGALFLGTGVCVSAVLVPQRHVAYLYRIRLYHTIAWIGFSLAAFAFLSTVPAAIGTLLWLIGALIASLFASRLYPLVNPNLLRSS